MTKQQEIEIVKLQREGKIEESYKLMSKIDPNWDKVELAN